MYCHLDVYSILHIIIIYKRHNTMYLYSHNNSTVYLRVSKHNCFNISACYIGIQDIIVSTRKF